MVLFQNKLIKTPNFVGDLDTLHEQRFSRNHPFDIQIRYTNTLITHTPPLCDTYNFKHRGRYSIYLHFPFSQQDTQHILRLVYLSFLSP